MKDTPTPTVPFSNLQEAVAILASTTKGRNLGLSGDPHYQPSQLKPFMGYDQRVLWQALVEWFILVVFAQLGIMPAHVARSLTVRNFERMMRKLTTTEVTTIERTVTNHDVLALLQLMRRFLPKRLHTWLHLAATSYDIIDTATALMMRETFQQAMLPGLKKLDDVWRTRIGENAESVMTGRTHLLHANPITAGFWLAQDHAKYRASSKTALRLSNLLHGKFSGPVGTSAAVKALFGRKPIEVRLMKLLGLKRGVATQIVQAEPLVRFLHELTLVSGTIAKLGGDVRILNMTGVREVSPGDKGLSSAMPNKGAGNIGKNPVGAEQMAGMHWSVLGEFTKVQMSMLVTDLQRDLRASSVMRGFGALFTFLMQQVNTATRLLSGIDIHRETCAAHLDQQPLGTSELLHLSLKLYGGITNSHTVVNSEIVPFAKDEEINLKAAMDRWARKDCRKRLWLAWIKVPSHIKRIISNPRLFTGTAISDAKRAARTTL